MKFDQLRENTHEFFIWWTGVDKTIFSSNGLERLKKPYAGLGALALLSTVLATVGAYSFIWSSLRSRPSAFVAAVFAGLFMWGFDRSVLGYISPHPSRTKVANLIKLVINISFSTMLAIPLATDVLNSGIAADVKGEAQENIEALDEKIDDKQGDLRVAVDRFSSLDDRTEEAYKADGSRNEAYDTARATAASLVNQHTADLEQLQRERKELVDKRIRYENSDYNYSDPNFSFSEKLNRVLSRRSEIGVGERIIALVTFLLSAIIGSGAVVARTVFIGDDSYAVRWRRKESIFCKRENAEHMEEQIEILVSGVPFLSDSFMDELDLSAKEFEKNASNLIRMRQDEILERAKDKRRERSHKNIDNSRNGGRKVSI